MKTTILAMSLLMATTSFAFADDSFLINIFDADGPTITHGVEIGDTGTPNDDPPNEGDYVEIVGELDFSNEEFQPNDHPAVKDNPERYYDEATGVVMVRDPADGLYYSEDYVCALYDTCS